MSVDNREKAMRWMAKKASEDSFFLGWAFSEYKKIHQIDDAELSDRLECLPEDLDRLSLCRLPTDTSDTFRHHVKQIADYVSCNADQLLMILRELSAILTIRRASKSNGDVEYLLAARDRTPENDD